MSQPEAILKTAIVKTLTAMGYMAMKAEQGSRRNKRLGLGTGSADILVIVRGMTVGLEAKVGKNKATDEQLEWGARLERAGGVYAVVRSVAEAVDVVRNARGKAA